MGRDPTPRVPIGLITAITALGSVSVSLYVPSLPAIGAEFAAGPAQVRLTLTAFLVTFALAQLAYGPLSDSYGRRPLVLAGAVIYVIGSVACLAAPTLTLLIAARIVQAIGASAGPALGRAIVRDVIPGDRIAGVLAIMATAIALSPTLGPFVGGLVETVSGWRSGFIVLTSVGLVLGTLLFLRLPETAPGDRSASLSAISIIRTYGGLLGDPTYLLFLTCGGLLTAGNFAWVAAAPFLFIQGFGFSTAEFGLVSLAVGGGLCCRCNTGYPNRSTLRYCEGRGRRCASRRLWRAGTLGSGLVACASARTRRGNISVCCRNGHRCAV